MNLARTIVIAGLGRIRGGHVEIVEDGKRLAFGPEDSDLHLAIKVHDPSFWRGALRGSLGLADAYLDGAWDCDDLTVLARIAARDLPRLDGPRRAVLPLRRLFERLPLNTIEGSRRHISAHYDIGNELFETFLDPTMTYSCATYDSPQMSLVDAQQAKLDRICRKLELGEGDHLLEIGSGWGSLAIHAAANYGCRVTTTTISRRQHELARQRIAEAGLTGRVNVLLEDYRELSGRFDKLVSIEMIEAVGWQYFDLFFRRCAELLREGGLMLLQAITIDDRLYELEKDTKTFTTSYIFPSGCLPSLEVMRRCASGAGLTEVGLEDITDSYPLTLRDWRRNFVAARERVTQLGYDRRFRRLWDLYLSWSEGGFLERRIQDYQQLLVAPGLTRARTESRELSLAASG